MLANALGLNTAFFLYSSSIMLPNALAKYRILLSILLGFQLSKIRFNFRELRLPK